jgi:hypothetical protein
VSRGAEPVRALVSRWALTGVEPARGSVAVPASARPLTIGAGFLLTSYFLGDRDNGVMLFLLFGMS